MELSYATPTLRRLCLDGMDPALDVDALRSLLAVIADLRAAPTLADAPLTIIGDSADEVTIEVRGTALRIHGTIAHIRASLPANHRLADTARLKLLTITTEVHR